MPHKTTCHERARGGPTNPTRVFASCRFSTSTTFRLCAWQTQLKVAAHRAITHSADERRRRAAKARAGLIEEEKLRAQARTAAASSSATRKRPPANAKNIPLVAELSAQASDQHPAASTRRMIWWCLRFAVVPCVCHVNDYRFSSAAACVFYTHAGASLQERKQEADGGGGCSPGREPARPVGGNHAGGEQ